MIGITFVVLALIMGMFLTPFNRRLPYGIRHTLREKRIAKLEEKRKRKTFAYHGWKYDKDANIEFTRKGISFKGGVRIQPSFKAKSKMRLKDKNTRRILRVALSLIVVVGLFHITGNAMSLIALGTAFTSNGTGGGDWDVVATWTAGSNYPQTGDTATIVDGDGVRVDVGTGNEQCFWVDVQGGGTLTVDCESTSAVSLIFDDTAGAGFLPASAGQFTSIGSATYQNILTSENNPPTNGWEFNPSTGDMDITMDYTTIEHYDGQALWSQGAIDVDNCTFQLAKRYGAVILFTASLTSFTNNSINANGVGYGIYLRVTGGYTAFDNITITNAGSDDLQLTYATTYEFTNSSWDASNVNFIDDGELISDTHNKVSGDWYYWSGATGMNKSDIANDFGATDNVIIYTGTLVADIAIAHTDMTIKSGGTLTVNQNITHTITHTTGRITVESGGTLNWNGASGNTITLQSSSQGTQWEIDLDSGGTINASWCLVRDSNATPGLQVDGTDNCSDVANNDNWDFGVGTYKIDGYTRASDDSILVGCTVDLFDADDESLVDTTVSDGATGFFEFTGLSKQSPYYMRAFKSASPDVFGTTKRTISGVAE